MTVPFDNHNNRVFFACQGVFVEERNSEAGNGGDPTANSVFLTGVQSLGVSSDNPSVSLLDVGRAQRKYTQYGQQTINITLDRVINKADDFFYKVEPAQYTTYSDSHLLHANNFGSKGAPDDQGKCLRNYDITVLYAPDRFGYLGGGVGGSDPDKDDVISVTYLNCLITNINYSISVDEVRESISLTTKNIKYNDDYSIITDYSFPNPFPELSEGGTWQPSTNYVSGQTVSGAQAGRIVFVCSSGGVSGAVEPTWNTTIGGSTSDNTVTWVARLRTNILKRSDFDLLDNSPQYGKTKLPTEVKELFNFNTPDIESELQKLGIQSINISADFSYFTMPDVGIWRGSEDTKEHEQNRWTYVNMPIDVTCSFTGVLRQGMPYSNFLSGALNRARNVDNIYTKSLGDDTSTDWQEADREIRIVALGNEVPQDYFIWDLGTKNYLTSIEYSGGDTGGSNVEATINYSNEYSDLVLAKSTSVINLVNNGPY